MPVSAKNMISYGVSRERNSALVSLRVKSWNIFQYIILTSAAVVVIIAVATPSVESMGPVRTCLSPRFVWPPPRIGDPEVPVANGNILPDVKDPVANESEEPDLVDGTAS
jgi:hypothetical protein